MKGIKYWYERVPLFCYNISVDFFVSAKRKKYMELFCQVVLHIYGIEAGSSKLSQSISPVFWMDSEIVKGSAEYAKFLPV